ncbi:hypothetical protein GCM10010399_65030 [Dactylosporangium fulvum]
MSHVDIGVRDAFRHCAAADRRQPETVPMEGGTVVESGEVVVRAPERRCFGQRRTRHDRLGRGFGEVGCTCRAGGGGGMETVHESPVAPETVPERYRGRRPARAAITWWDV